MNAIRVRTKLKYKSVMKEAAYRADTILNDALYEKY